MNLSSTALLSTGLFLSVVTFAQNPSVGNVTATGTGTVVAVGIVNGPVTVNGTPVGPQERWQRIEGFLNAKHLPIPGGSYSDGDLISQYGVGHPSPMNLSFDVLSGNFSGMSLRRSTPIGDFTTIVVRNGTETTAVVAMQSCAGKPTIACENNFTDWSGAIQNIEGSQIQTSELQIGSPGPGPFPPGKLRKLYAYDGQWSFYVDRVDAGSGPTIISLVIVRRKT
jgi:hypothetical protein